MNARDVMTTDVVSVGPDTTVRQIAGLLLKHGISAVPVVDAERRPIGMVSEGDLIGRAGADREARRDWWLTLLAEGEPLSPDFLAYLHSAHRAAHGIMISPVVTVDEETAIDEIARLLADYRIKRVPVVRDGRIVGIVSRADLVRALAADGTTAPAALASGSFTHALAELEARFPRRQHASSQSAAPPPEPDDTQLTAADLRTLVANFKQKQHELLDEAHRAKADQRRRRVAELIDEHVLDPNWRALLHRARQGAERGEKEFMLLRFPSQLCSDGGRAINVAETGWPGTLRGEPAELYLRWERDLKPHGFRLAARVLEFPGGKPGDIGLFLIWE